MVNVSSWFTCSDVVGWPIRNSISRLKPLRRNMCEQALIPYKTWDGTCVNRPWYPTKHETKHVWTGLDTLHNMRRNMCEQALIPYTTWDETCVNRPWYPTKHGNAIGVGVYLWVITPCDLDTIIVIVIIILLMSIFFNINQEFLVTGCPSWRQPARIREATLESGNLSSGSWTPPPYQQNYNNVTIHLNTQQNKLCMNLPSYPTKLTMGVPVFIPNKKQYQVYSTTHYPRGDSKY